MTEKKQAINIPLKLRPLSWYRGYLKDRMDKLNAETKQKANLYFYIGLTLFTVSFFGFFAIKPTMETVSNLNKQYEDNKLIYNALKNKLSALQTLDASYQLIQPDLSYVYAAIPKTSKIPYLARQIETLAQQNNVTLNRLDFQRVELYPGIKTTGNYSVAFNLAVQGSELNINSFIASLINFDRILSIDRIATGKNDNNIFSGSITARAYFSK